MREAALQCIHECYIELIGIILGEVFEENPPILICQVSVKVIGLTVEDRSLMVANKVK